MGRRSWVALGMSVLLCACVTDSGAPRSGARLELSAPGWKKLAGQVYTAPGVAAPQSGDLYLPGGKGPHPLIVLVHGGGWIRGSRDQMDSIAERAADHGYAVFNISYRLAPEHPYPAALDDVRAAIAWGRSHAGEFRLDPARVAVWGYSAGANLAALAGLQDAPPGEQVEAVVAGGLPSNLTDAADNDMVQAFMGGTIDAHPDRYRAASPLLQVSPGDPPMFLYHGSWDLVVWSENARNMKAALDAAGVPAELYIVHGLGHIPMFLFDGGAVRAALDFLDHRLAQVPTARVAAGGD